MRALLLATVAAGAVAAAILAAGGFDRIDVLLLAIFGSVPFFDVVRRAFSDVERGTGDMTDLWMGVSFATILVAAAWERRDAPPASLADLRNAVVLLGVALIGLGVALRIWAFRTMGSDFRIRLDVRTDQNLVQDGPFRAIRHPNYAALLVVALGTAAALESVCALAVTLGVWLPTVIFRVAREERLLAGRFGVTWEAYRRRTSRFIPGVY